VIVLGIDPGTTTGYGVIAQSRDGALEEHRP
jgi:Holliday junction resolvasome RuvABC endonuclease subunit